MHPKIDPQLLAQLADASEHDIVEAIFRLAPSEETRDPGRLSEMVDRILKTAATETGTQPLRRVVFRFLGAFSVAAPKRLLKRLLRDKALLSAAANRQPDGAVDLLPRKRPVR